jgi:hypothetical protein
LADVMVFLASNAFMLKSIRFLRDVAVFYSDAHRLVAFACD